MRFRQPDLPLLWIVSDARNDSTLEQALRRLPRGSGLIFRHYHLGEGERRSRFRALARIARQCGHVVILSGTPAKARRWKADGSYGPPSRTRRITGQLRLLSAHSAREIAMANRAKADAVLLSPAFATRSHPGAPTLGPMRFRLLANLSAAPVIALGGMSARAAKRLIWRRFAAIDGLS